MSSQGLGWRSEFARVTKLLSLPGQEQTVREVASAYGEPVGRLPEPVRFEGGPLDGSIRFGTPMVESFTADYSFACVSLRPSSDTAFVVEEEGGERWSMR